MKVFFTASQRGKKYFGEYYKRIFNHLVKLGYQHTDDMIIKIDSKDFYQQLEEKGYEKHKWLFHNFVKQVKIADIVVFELSLHSLSIGFMIEKALEIGKPVVILYVEENLPYFLAGITDERLHLIEYDTNNLETKLEETMKIARSNVNTRFNFFVSRDMLNYLNEVSNKLEITKSTYIRNLINEHRKKFTNQSNAS